MKTSFSSECCYDEIPFLLNTKIEIIKNNELKYKAEIIQKTKVSILLSLGEIYTELEIKPGDILQYFCGLDERGCKIFYNCYSNVKNVKRYANKIYIEISYPQETNILGIRNFFRLPIEMEIYYRLINYLDHYSSVDNVPSKYYENMNIASTLDLSGSGVKIEIEKFSRKGQEIALVLPPLDNMKLIGTIHWLEPDKFNQNIKVSISFKNIKEQDQDKIIYFLFSEISDKRKRD